MRPRPDRDLASVLSHLEPGWWEYSGQAGVGDVFLIRKVAAGGLCLWLSVCCLCHLCLDELRAGVPAVLSGLNLHKVATAIGAQVDVF